MDKKITITSYKTEQGASATGTSSGSVGIPAGVAMPSSLWKQDRSAEYLTVDEEATEAQFTTAIRAAGTIASSSEVVAYSTGAMSEELPMASADALGCIKVGDGLTVTADGTLKAQSGGPAASPFPLDISLNGVQKLSYDGSSQKNLDITASGVGAAPASHSHSQYLTGVGLSDWNSAASSSGDKLIGNSGNGSYVTIQEDLRVYQNAAFSKTPTVNGSAVALSSELHNHSNKSTLDAINQSLSTGSNVQFNSVKSQNDVVAYTTGSAAAPFKYWYPSVNSSGTLSWTNSTSEATPASVNIKGANGTNGSNGRDGTNGTNGQGTTYQWSGTSLRLGTISPAGSTSWGSYVNLKGDTGATGSSGSSFNGGTITNNLALERSGTIGINLIGSRSATDMYAASFIQFYNNYRGGSTWQINHSGQGDLFFIYGEVACMFLSCVNKGNVWIKGSLSQNSDIRLKHRFENVGDVLNKLDNIDAFYYTLKEDENKIRRIGVSAQDVKEQFPELVSLQSSNDAEGKAYYSVNYIDLATTVAVNGCKELHQLIKDQQTRISDLEKRLSQLETKLEMI